MNVTRFLLLLLGLCAALAARSQEVVKTQDLGLWMGVKLEKEVKDDFTFLLSQEFRLNESVQALDKMISEFGVEYKINRNFRLRSDGRYAINYKPDRTYSQDLRYNLDLKYKGRIDDRMAFKYRMRFQRRHENFFHPIGGGSDAAFRHRAALDYEINDQHRLQLSGEIFREIELHQRPHFEKYRLMLSDDFTSGWGEFEWAVGYERELETSTPLTYYIVSVYYTIPL